MRDWLDGLGRLAIRPRSAPPAARLTFGFNLAVADSSAFHGKAALCGLCRARIASTDADGCC